MFLTPLKLATDPQPDMWVLTAPLIWIDPVRGRLTVPVGFRTDLASIPRVFRNLPFLDPNGLSRLPAVLHDWLYAVRVYGKDFADMALRDALISQGAGGATAATFYYAVHFFGDHGWESDEGKLDTTDFDTQAHYFAWKSANPQVMWSEAL